MAFRRIIGKPLAATIIFAVFAVTSFSIIEAFADESGKDATTIKSKIVDFLKSKRVKATDERLKTIADTVYEEALECDVDYRLILAVMKVESNFRNEAVSKMGARGLLQIMPSLAKHLSKDTGIAVKGTKSLHEPEKNIKLGVNHISGLIEKFENLNTALHAYNVGSHRIRNKASKEYSPNTPFTRKVLHEYDQICLVLPESEESE
jgi:soluble lytic murein transglycosylase